MSQKRVLFLCTGDASRGQMAKGLVDRFLRDSWQAESAIPAPVGLVNPFATEALSELHIQLAGQHLKTIEELNAVAFDLVMTLCEDVKQSQIGSQPVEWVHIGFEDPARTVGSHDEQLQAFRRVHDNIRKSMLLYLQQLYTAKELSPFATERMKPGETPGMESLMRTYFVQELRRLQDELLMMGSMVNQALCDSLDVLKRQDLEKAKQIIIDDRVINGKRYKIEEDCLTLIATQQPMAGDMRLIAGMLEIASELERIGDYAKGIARIALYIGKEPLIKPLIDLPTMCTIVVEMLRGSLDAFVNQDVEQARLIPKRDDEVDALYNKINRELIDIVVKDPSRIDQANYLSWAAHNMERAADRSTNICERIIYTVTGQFVEMDVDEPGLSRVA